MKCKLEQALVAGIVVANVYIVLKVGRVVRTAHSKFATEHFTD